MSTGAHPPTVPNICSVPWGPVVPRGNTVSATVPLPPPSSSALAPVLAAVDAIETAVRRCLEVLGALDGRRVAAEEGLPVDHALRCLSGAAGADIATLQAAADLLDRAPALARWYRGGGLSWGHLRQLVAGTRRFDRARLDQLDTWIAAHADRIAALDVELQADALDHVLRELTDRRTLETREARELDADRLWLQLQVDGSCEGRFRYGPLATAELAAALDAEADQPSAPPCPSGGDVPEPSERPSRPGQLADALLRLVRRAAGRRDDGTPRAGAPVRFTVTVDLDQLTDSTAGRLQTALRGRAPRLTAATVDRLACDTALDLVLRDGTDLLAAQRYAPDVTATVRRAVTARDQGCRFPTCTAPAAWCDLHHVHPRAAGGDHRTGNLVLLCRRHHTLVHRRGWRQTLTPDATYTLRRRGRTLTSHPRTTTSLARPDPRPPDPRPPDRPPPLRLAPEPDPPPDTPDPDDPF
ncbi:DUF222 domain-containing protein [Nitriliruptoraceae bacterium ZYF776]|nr:DUF222 domain-containing protein [Profundirhabdus halotolerans]